jgi:mutator protein MutT
MQAHRCDYPVRGALPDVDEASGRLNVQAAPRAARGDDHRLSTVDRAVCTVKTGRRDSTPSAGGSLRAVRRQVPCVGAIVHDDARRLLLVRRGRPPHAGSWSLPGGRIEAGETPRQAVVREVAEETGLVVVPDRLVGQVKRDGPDSVVYVIDDYACTAVSGRLVAGDDASDAAFVDRTGLDALTLSPGLLDALTAWSVLPA